MAQPTEPPPPVNRLLGATSSATDGNVRAMISVLAMIGLHALFTVLLIAFVRGAASELKDFLLTMGAAIVTLDTGCVSFYFGRRAGDGA